MPTSYTGGGWSFGGFGGSGFGNNIYVVPSGGGGTGGFGLSSTLTVADIAKAARVRPELNPIIPVSGFVNEPSLTISNDVMQRFLAQNLDWKFNRSYAPSFLTVQLQQDYVSDVTNLSWLEGAWRVDINNTSTPKPFATMESVRDLIATSSTGVPFQVSWLPNSLAQMGQWQANTAYNSGVGLAQMPVSPIQQFVDINQNILRVVGFGTSGDTQPAAPAASIAGTPVADGGVTWAVTDPNGVAFRLGVVPPTAGNVYQINPVYQRKPPILTKGSDLISPIPDELGYLFRQGFVAFCYDYVPDTKSNKGPMAQAKWMEDVVTALRSGDREREEALMYPSGGSVGAASVNGFGYFIDAAQPYAGCN